MVINRHEALHIVAGVGTALAVAGPLPAAAAGENEAAQVEPETLIIDDFSQAPEATVGGRWSPLCRRRRRLVASALVNEGQEEGAEDVAEKRPVGHIIRGVRWRCPLQSPGGIIGRGAPLQERGGQARRRARRG